VKATRSPVRTAVEGSGGDAMLSVIMETELEHGLIGSISVFSAIQPEADDVVVNPDQCGRHCNNGGGPAVIGIHPMQKWVHRLLMTRQWQFTASLIISKVRAAMRLCRIGGD